MFRPEKRNISLHSSYLFKCLERAAWWSVMLTEIGNLHDSGVLYGWPWILTQDCYIFLFWTELLRRRNANIHLDRSIYSSHHEPVLKSALEGEWLYPGHLLKRISQDDTTVKTEILSVFLLFLIHIKREYNIYLCYWPSVRSRSLDIGFCVFMARETKKRKETNIKHQRTNSNWPNTWFSY